MSTAEQLPGAEPFAADVRPATRTGIGQRGRERAAAALQRNGALLVLVLMSIIAAVSFPAFATTDNLRNVLTQSSFLALVAFGMTFVILTGGIDLSVGSLYALGGVLAAYGSEHGVLVGLALPLGTCAIIGLAQGLIISRLGLPPFIVTLAGLLGVRGLVLAVTDEGATTRTLPPDSFVTTLGQGQLFGIQYPVWIAVVACGGLLVVLRRTGFGQSLYAIGGRGGAARLMGLPVHRSLTLAYVLSGTLAGAAGALLAARSSSGVPIVGVGVELDAIAAVVIGGTLLTGGAGSLTGTVCGVLLLGVIQNCINLIGSLNSSYQSVVSGGFLALVVTVQAVLARRQRL